MTGWDKRGEWTVPLWAALLFLVFEVCILLAAVSWFSS